MFRSVSNSVRTRKFLLGAFTLALACVLAACAGRADTSAGSAPSRTSQDASQPEISPSSSLSPTPIGTRPAVTPTASHSHPSGKPKPTPLGTPGQFVFPVVGTVGYAHTHHDYPATDIIAACGDTVRAVTSGVVLDVTRVDTYKRSVNAGATRGGLSVSIKGDDGVRYYGSHMELINKNIQPGVRVKVGQSLGKVGRTGDAGACHLHFGISPACPGMSDWWTRRGAVYPWSYLDSWRKGGDKSPVSEVTAWHKKYGCPTKPLVDP